VSLDRSESNARRRLRKTVEGWYGRPFEMIAALQAMYAGTADGLGAYLEPYLNAGLEHVVLRVADAPERGLEAAARAARMLSPGRHDGSATGVRTGNSPSTRVESRGSARARAQ
jgi:hypothetical protein